jgi:bacterioferritin-associated ferredoxin
LIVCSCNYIDTADIKAVLNYATEPNEQQVLNMLAWTPECAYCKDLITNEIRRCIKEMTDGA